MMTDSAQDFEEAHARFRAAFDTLLALAANYPEERRAVPGACGEWSPREVLAHLSGWIREAQHRYGRFASGTDDDITYDEDAFNEQSLESRAYMDWNQTLSELRGLAHELSEQAQAVPPQLITAEPRYGHWLDSLAADCEQHTLELRAFEESR
jgi:uncharacterized protein (TIGR03083 family)